MAPTAWTLSFSSGFLALLVGVFIVLIVEHRPAVSLRTVDPRVRDRPPMSRRTPAVTLAGIALRITAASFGPLGRGRAYQVVGLALLSVGTVLVLEVQFANP